MKRLSKVEKITNAWKDRNKSNNKDDTQQK